MWERKLVQFEVLCLLKALSAEDSIFEINFEYKIFVLYLKVKVQYPTPNTSALTKRFTF